MSEQENPDLVTGQGVCTDVTLRDLFAAFALAGRCARDEGDSTFSSDAEYCYTAADALLEERAK